METLQKTRPARKTEQPEKHRPKKAGPKPAFRLFLVMLFSIVMALTYRDIIEMFDGEPGLNRKREKALKKQISEIENAVQYVLLTTSDDWYECYLCPSKKIYLLKGEVWKYGVTRKGERIRYTSEFPAKNNLVFIIEFEGDYAACLIQEKIKIFNYPLLPENQKRPEALKLAYPPGNTSAK
jgi:hypothetical protein